MSKKEILISGIFCGIGFYYLPKMLLDSSILITILQVTGMIIMFSSIVWVVAGNIIKGWFGKGDSGFSRDLKKKLKYNQITPQEAHKLEIERLDNEIAKQNKMVDIQEKKTKIQKLKQQSKPDMGFGFLGGGSGDPSQKKQSSFPDVLGNISPLMGSGGSNSQQPSPPPRVPQRQPQQRKQQVRKTVRQQRQQPRPPPQAPPQQPQVDPLVALNEYVNPKQHSQILPELNDFTRSAKKKQQKKAPVKTKKKPAKTKKYHSSRIGGGKQSYSDFYDYL